jgi:hypothetical protein
VARAQDLGHELLAALARLVHDRLGLGHVG